MWICICGDPVQVFLLCLFLMFWKTKCEGVREFVNGDADGVLLLFLDIIQESSNQLI